MVDLLEGRWRTIMEYQRTMTIEAPADRVWALLADVARWPSWTPTVTAVRVDGDGVAVGTEVEVRQPGRRPSRLSVSVFEVGRRFEWGSDRGGVRQRADHVVVPSGDRSCTVTLTFAMAGPVGTLLGVLGAGRIRRLVDTEATSLKAHAEAATADTG